MLKPMINSLITPLSFIAGAYCLFIIFIYFTQGSLLFFPNNEDFSTCPELKTYDSFPTIIQKDNEEIRFYLRQISEARGWVIHFHGNAGRACNRSFVLENIGDLPLNIILAEYPGYSGNADKPGEKAFLSNARALLNYVEQENKHDLPIFLYGESLGTGVSIKLASEFDIEGLILQSPYTSIADVGQHHYPYLPVKLLAKHKFKADNWAKQVKSDVIILHGKKDRVIPIEFGKKLATSFPGKVDFQEFPDRGHNDMVHANPHYWNVVRDFLTKRSSR